MEVIKRDGSKQPMLFDKISQRIQTLVSMSPPLTHINVPKLAIKIIEQLHDQISTSKIDELTAQECAAQSTTHLDFGTLAGRIVISNNHKNTNASLVDISTRLYDAGYINSSYYDIICQHQDEFQSMLDFSRDYLIDYFGFKTLERAYLIKVNEIVTERPQHMWMRVAIAIHGNEIELVRETYDLMSQKYFTHATPTLFNAGAKHQQLSSCF